MFKFFQRTTQTGHRIRAFQWQQGDVLSDFAHQLAKDLAPEEHEAWLEVLQASARATGSKPTKIFLKNVEERVVALPETTLVDMLVQIFHHVATQKEIRVETVYRAGTPIAYHHTAHTFLSDSNANTLKGLTWAVLPYLDSTVVAALVGLADRCFKKIPGKGYASGSVGNAVLWTLAKSIHPEGIAYLSKLKLKNIQTNTKSLIEGYLVEAARKFGLSVIDLEELHVPDFGLDSNGQVEQYFDGYRAVIRLENVGKAVVEWYKPDGSPQKSIPASVKETHPEALKRLSALAKDLGSHCTAQRDRFDRMFRIERVLPFERFENTILRHGLMGWLARRLIWTITGQDGSVNAFFNGENWHDSLGRPLDWVGKGCTIQLWHPANSATAETLRWRAFLEKIKLVQPMKQAFREIYLLTEAELRTRTYSNRFAAHLLKQSQFAALARMRGWRYTLLGAYDDGRDNSLAVLDLPEKSLRAEYWVGEVNADDSWSESGIWHYIATDQVRFYQSNAPDPMNLVDVPPIVLSEVMRDADLFVGVASVGNDPTWRDSGGLPAFRDYWQSYSFGDLSETAKSRRDILERLVPRLKIAAVSEIRDRFLVVKGKIRTYKIHLGSGNILMEPNDQYLCIVPDRSAKTATTQSDLFLPFEGDSGLSLILSKAFLLAADDLITDTTIVRQIKN